VFYFNESGSRAQILRLAIKIGKAKNSIVFFVVSLMGRVFVVSGRKQCGWPTGHSIFTFALRMNCIDGFLL
jgi:hypothetical protein